MRFVLYNIRYATGIRAHGFVRPSHKNLERIGSFLRELEPDIVGLVEVDYGSYRMGRKIRLSYWLTLWGITIHIPANTGSNLSGVISRLSTDRAMLFLPATGFAMKRFIFDRGMKRLVIELELDHLVVYLVHLSLGGKTRHQQLANLYELVKMTTKPCVVAGDFNMLWGEREIDLFLAATGLQNANSDSLPTYPSRNPSRHLDFILHSPEIAVSNFQVPRVMFSDHLPVVVDFDVKVEHDLRSAVRESHCSCVRHMRDKTVRLACMSE